MAKGTIERAADLARHTKSTRSSHARDKDGFGFDAWSEPEEIFPRSIIGDQTLNNLRPRNAVPIAELFPHRFADIGHGGEVADAEIVDPAPDLPRAHPRFFVCEPQIGRKARGNVLTAEAHQR